MFGRFRNSSSRRGGTAVAEQAGTVPDDLPRDAFFARPLTVTDLETAVADHADGVRVSFVATVRDAEGKRCPEIAVHARVIGPHRDATGMGHTSMLGKVTFRMAGPAGTYRCVIEDVAGGALGLDEAASTLTATVSARPESA